MPQAPIHQRQRRKNLMLMGVLLGIVVIFFAMTVVKLGSKSTPEPATSALAQ